MTEVVFSGDIFPVVGCKDPLAINYNPSATSSCSNCCQYGKSKLGCTDPLAFNYNINATESCTSCCNYKPSSTGPSVSGIIPNLNSLLSARYDPPPPGSILNINCDYYGAVSKNRELSDPDNFGYGISFRDFQAGYVYGGIQEGYSFFDPTGLNYGLGVDLEGSLPGTISLAHWYYLYTQTHNTEFGWRFPQLWASIFDFVDRGGIFYYYAGDTGGVDGQYGLLESACCGVLGPRDAFDTDGNLIGTFANIGNFDTTNYNIGTQFAPSPRDTSVSNPVPYGGICEDAYQNWVNGEGPGPDPPDITTTTPTTTTPTTTTPTTTTPSGVQEDCISDINKFINLISTSFGSNFFNTYFSSNIGPALFLTTAQIQFIQQNINNNSDTNGNGTPDQTEARLILSNALQATGGFYVNQPYTSPSLVSQVNCGSGKYWDSTHQICMCAPIVTSTQCLIDITQVQTITVTTPVTYQAIVYSSNNNPLSEACCNKLIRDYNLVGVWEWVPQLNNCAVKSSVNLSNCVPAVFSLNNNNMSIPPCSSNIEISMWLYFGIPDNPCQTVSKRVDDIINVVVPPNDITITPNYNLIERNPARPASLSFIEVNSLKEFDVLPEPTSTNPCCYDTNNPILAKISLNNNQLNNSLIQVKEYNSIVDGFDNWVELKVILPISGTSSNFSVNLEVYQGLTCCCDYKFFVDDIKVGCLEQKSVRVRNDFNCIGFELTKVIDNKKSWVYNPGLPSVGITEYDEIERADGSFSLLNGEGTINRTFAPSLDADIPWRYTNYWKQSSVYEKHSNLVLNSKELWLTFDMCADCPISGTTLTCPQGYSLSTGHRKLPRRPAGGRHGHGWTVTPGAWRAGRFSQ